VTYTYNITRFKLHFLCDVSQQATKEISTNENEELRTSTIAH